MAEEAGSGPPRLDPHNPRPPAWSVMPADAIVRRAVDPDPSGVLRRRRPNAPPVLTISDRYLIGAVDLRAVEFPYLLEFVRCRFERPPDLRQAKIAGCEFNNCALPGLEGRNLHSDNDILLVNGTTVLGTVDLTDADLHGSLILLDSVLSRPDGRALHANRLQLAGAMIGARMTVHGELRIPGMRVGGNINLNGAVLDNPKGLALDGNSLQVGGNMHLGVDAGSGKHFQCSGQISMPAATIASDFSLRGARLSPRTEHSRPAPPDDPFFDPEATLVMDRVTVNGNVNLDRGMTSTGTLRIVNAFIRGSLRLSEATVDLSQGVETFTEHFDAATSTLEPYQYRSLHLDGTEIRGGIDARKARFAGQLRAVDVSVRGSVLFDGAVLSNRNGDAVEGRRFSVGGNIDARGVFVSGSMLLPGAKIGANLDLRASRFVNPGRYSRDRSNKPSLDLRVAQIGRDLICSAGDRASFSAQGEIRMRRAEIGRETNFSGAELGSTVDGTSLNAFGIQTQELRLEVGAPPRGRVVLRHARCAYLADNGRFWDAGGRIDVEDFRYDALRNAIDLKDDDTVRQRLRWLRHAMRDEYRPGPYDQFALMLRNAGNEEHASTVLIDKQKWRYRALAEGYRVLGPGVRVWSWLQRLMVGYGYRPTRALVWLLTLLVVGTVWFATNTAPHEINDNDHLVWNPLLYTLDQLVPIVDFGNKNRWHITGASQWISAGFVAAGWVLATTVAAGVTRMLRRNS